jgi:hypothetical protein
MEEDKIVQHNNKKAKKINTSLLLSNKRLKPEDPELISQQSQLQLIKNFDMSSIKDALLEKTDIEKNTEMMIELNNSIKKLIDVLDVLEKYNSKPSYIS